MAETLTLTKIVRKDTDKEGNKLKTKDGREYTRLGIQCREHGQKWLSGFSAPWNEGWKEGDAVSCEVQQKGEYLNISKPDPLAEMAKAVFNLGVEVGKLRERVKSLEDDTAKVVHRKPTPAELDEPPAVNDTELPW